MRTFDFSPLYRSAIGFDRLAQMMNEFNRAEGTNSAPSYPPYNIELVSENQYRITMAVAGFKQEELNIEAQGESLTVTGRKPKLETEPSYLHRGIAARDFEHNFKLADHVKVTQAHLDNGLLHIELVREMPEEDKPRRIEISNQAYSTHTLAAQSQLERAA